MRKYECMVAYNNIFIGGEMVEYCGTSNIVEIRL